ncbi:MAG: lipoate--protein ligase family protein [Synergistaceae bacterium]|nr:lipoate--protein ligase family protein [Synergistaceae bacterium]
MKNNPAFNLAYEEYLFTLGRECFFLWQNEPAVILGRFTNIDEVNINFVRENNIKIVRRNSGGGAVYHDLGNINYSFILHDKKNYSLKFFAGVIINALSKIGVNGVLTFNHNDLLVNDYKFSGMAQYRRNNILLHHGTLLFDSDLSIIQKVLRRSGKVANLKNFLTRDINIQEFMTLLRENINFPCGLPEINYSPVKKLMLDKYLNPDWNNKI